MFGAATDIIKNIGDYFADDNNRAEFAESARKFIKTLSDGIVTLLQSSAPLLVEAGKAWITVFCGAIDYDASAMEITKQLAAAFVRNFGSGFKELWDLITNPNETLDNWIYGGEIATDRAGIRISDELQEQYLESGTSLGSITIVNGDGTTSTESSGNPIYIDTERMIAYAVTQSGAKVNQTKFTTGAFPFLQTGANLVTTQGCTVEIQGNWRDY